MFYEKLLNTNTIHFHQPTGALHLSDTLPGIAKCGYKSENIFSFCKCSIVGNKNNTIFQTLHYASRTAKRLRMTLSVCRKVTLSPPILNTEWERKKF